MAHDSSSAALSAGRMQMPGKQPAMEPCSLDWSPSAAVTIGGNTCLSAQYGLSGGGPPCWVCLLMSGPCTCFRLVDVCRAHVDLLDMCGMAQTQEHVTVAPDAVSSAREVEVLAGLGNILMARVPRAWSCYWLVLLVCCSNTAIGASLNSSGARVGRMLEGLISGL